MTITAAQIREHAEIVTCPVLAARLLDTADLMEGGGSVVIERLKLVYRNACNVHGPSSASARSAWHDLNREVTAQLRSAA